jgi:hypothetical protein
MVAAQPMAAEDAGVRAPTLSGVFGRAAYPVNADGVT